MNENMTDKRISSLISLCARARLAKSGEEKCEKALRNGEAKLMIISRDASDNTKKKFTNKAFFYNVPVIYYGQKLKLGKLTGTGAASSVCVTDAKLSEKIRALIESSKDACPSADPASPPGGMEFANI